MQLLTLDQFLALGWSPSMQVKLSDIASRTEVSYLLAWDNAGKMSCSAWNEPPTDWTGAQAVWSKHGNDPRPVTEVVARVSKTMQAVQLVEDEGLTVYAAAKRVGIHDSAVHKALKRREGKAICECCGQVIRGQAPVPSGA